MKSNLPTSSLFSKYNAWASSISYYFSCTWAILFWLCMPDLKKKNTDILKQMTEQGFL